MHFAISYNLIVHSISYFEHANRNLMVKFTESIWIASCDLRKMRWELVASNRLRNLQNSICKNTWSLSIECRAMRCIYGIEFHLNSMLDMISPNSVVYLIFPIIMFYLQCLLAIWYNFIILLNLESKLHGNGRQNEYYVEWMEYHEPLLNPILTLTSKILRIQHLLQCHRWNTMP